MYMNAKFMLASPGGAVMADGGRSAHSLRWCGIALVAAVC
jgi:hypothetical protein